MIDQKITDDLKIFAKRIMDNEGISQYELDIEGQTDKGVNYGSEIVFFSVKTTGKKYNFVMKTSKRSEAIRKASEDGVVDAREMFMYSKVFPALRQLLAEVKADYQLKTIAKTYLINTEYLHETNIMEDLRAQGYKLWNKNLPMNMEHIKTVLKNYGQYHASSMALRLKKPEVFKELTADLNSIFKYFVNNEMVKKLFGDYVQDALDILNDEGLKDIAGKLKEVPENALAILAKTVDDDDKVVITHGDCWINNMMFNYENPETTKPSGVRFLDFQLSSFGSPASDLSYYLYTSLDEDTISNKFDQLLEFYYDSLSSTLKSLGVEPEEVLTYQKLREHWRKYAISGLIMASQVIKIQLTNREEAPDLSDFETRKDFSGFRVGDIENNEAFRSRIVAVYKHYAKTCLY